MVPFVVGPPFPLETPRCVANDVYRIANGTLSVRLCRPSRGIVLRAERVAADSYRIRAISTGAAKTDRFLDAKIRLPARWRTVELVEGSFPDAPSLLLASRG